MNHDLVKNRFMQQKDASLVVTSSRTLWALKDRHPSWNEAFCVGKATADRMAEMGFQCVVGQGNAQSLIPILKEHGGPLLFLVGDKTLDTLDGIEMERVQVYKTVPKVEHVPEGVWILCSPSAVHLLQDRLKEHTLIAFGPTTAKAITDLGLECIVCPSPSPEGLLEAASHII
ncbi:tetrapyrrole biosynthesis, uroporphyrinogen III synthase [Gorgonomyces haynaldii]|nr:tetrapyrrole biosynthesis, uroporphyrinogen III synthase [Gorgonomyces haynaldii]